MISHKIILFDGICNLCNAWVQFVIQRDKKDIFRFASLQSDIAKKLLYYNSGNSPVEMNNNLTISSIVLIEEEKIYTKSTAVLRILKNLPLFWPLMYSFIIVPAFIRDKIYNIIANHRYDWFGKRSSCMIPKQSVNHKFLEN